MNREKRVKREKTGKKERLGWENFSWLTCHFADAYAYYCDTALECGYLLLQVRPLDCYFQQKTTKYFRVM